MPRSRLLTICLARGLRLSLRADPASGRDELQRRPSDDDLERLFAALVHRAGAGQGADRLGAAVAAHRRGLATALGAIAGVALARLGQFPGRALFARLLAAPLVLPDLLIGLSLLLLFVAVQQAIGWPQRGTLTIIIAHVTMNLAFVAIVVQARLAEAGTALEEAAADLGAPPWTGFRRVTLPLMAPALLSGWLLAFTLSLDDVVVASFTSGPGATTLPMQVYSALHLGATPILNALATVILLLVSAVLLAVLKLRRRPDALP